MVTSSDLFPKEDGVERIVISIRACDKEFVVHEQPESWFRPRCLRRIRDNHGKYSVETCSRPELRTDTCFMAVRESQLGKAYYILRVSTHNEMIFAARRAVAALLNIARCDGYEFVLRG